MMTFNNSTSALIKAAFVACMMTTVAACGSTTSTEPPASSDPRLAHPIQVTREQVSVTIDLPAAGLALAPEDSRRLTAFIRDFVERGRTAVTVESQLSMLARDVLLANGLRGGEVILAPDTTIKAPGALLTFTANVAQVPTCGDWSDSYTFQPSNQPSKDFGCSNRRNTGLTVADPGDLIESQPMSGKGAARRDTVLDNYNSGQPIATPNNSTQAVSGVAQ